MMVFSIMFETVDIYFLSAFAVLSVAIFMMQFIQTDIVKCFIM